MTPSEYGESRSPEHDMMQAEVFEWLRDHGPKTLPYKEAGRTYEMERTGIWVEHMIEVNGSIRGFVDIVETWRVAKSGDRTGGADLTFYSGWEVKPNIVSCGGLIRQMRATALLLEQSGQQHGRVKVRIFPAVRHNDPQLPLLRRMWPTFVALWDREKGALS